MKVLLRLVGYSLERRALFIITAVVMVCSIVPRVAIPRLTGNAIDEALASAHAELALVVGQIVLAGLIRAVLGYLALYMGERVGRETDYRLRNDFFDKLQSLNFGFYDRQKTGDLMSRATVDIDATGRFISIGFLHGISALVSYILPIAVMITIEWRMGLGVLACFILVSWFGVSLAARLYRANRRIFQETGRMNTLVQEGLSGMRTVKALGSRDYELTRFRERAGAVAASSILEGQLAVTRDAVLMFLFAVATAGVLLVGGWQVQQGSLSPGALASFVLYMVMLAASIGGFEWRVHVFSRALAAGERIFEVLDTRNPLEVPADARDLSPTGRVEFDSVSFEYDTDVPALHGVSFELQPGQTAAIVGAAGSGKSTIAHLLPRFYDVSAGRVLIDGLDVRDVTLESLRRNVGIVQQDVFAFSATIRDNIAYGVDDPSMDDLVRAAKVAQLHNFIEGLPDGYDTWVGERGITLSGGQRQRLAIARTILLDTPILVLDDSTSSVDVGTEAQIHRAMEYVMKGRTSLVIAHRLSTVRNADTTLVLDRGRIVESGLARGAAGAERLLSQDSRPAAPARRRDAGARLMAATTGQTQGAARLDLEQDRPIRYWRTLVRLLGYARPYRGKIALALAAMLVYSGTMMALPWTVKRAIDGQVMSDDGSFAGLAAAVGLFCLVALLRLATGVVHSRLLVRFGESLILDIRTRLFEHIQALSMSFYDRNQAGRVMSRVQNDVMELSQALFAVLAFALADLFSVVGIAIAMLLMDVTLAAITLSMVALLIPSLIFWRWLAQPHLRRARVTVAGVNSGIQENVAGIRVVQSLNRQKHNASAFRTVNSDNLEASLKSARYRYGLWPSVELLAVIATAIVIYVGGRMIGTSLEVGLLVAFALYIDRLFEPIRDLTGEFGQLTGSLVAADRVFELLDVTPDVATAPDAVALPAVTGRVKYENVSFHYAPESPVLGDISLDVEPGETVALVGPTGAGKTTLVSLLMRLYDVTEGRIVIDGHDVREVTPDSLSRQISAVPQEPFLFSATVGENIRYNRTDLTDAEVVKAAKAVGAHDFIDRMKDGYDTELEERGANLSMGQRQLISFARALARNPRILILDEATANVDTETELQIQQALESLMEGRTSFVIAHRLSTVQNADRIVVLDQGRIVEQGTHSELLSNRGLYHDLLMQASQPPPSD